MHTLQLDQLTKTFDLPTGTVVAADHVSMEVQEGEVCVLLGPSGCGKTTTLKMINRLIPKTSGRIFLDGADTDQFNPIELRRSMGYVIQANSLFPNMTVAQNIGVVPRMLKWAPARIARRTRDLLDMVGLDQGRFAERYPHQLSGGQQQRVGVARALAADPPILIMDEPFGAIDPINREKLQDEFLKMQQQLRKTVLLVSHDIGEAIKLGSKIAIFRNGRLEQYDTPDRILAHPANAFITDFVGKDRTLKRLQLWSVRDAYRPRPGADPAVGTTATDSSPPDTNGRVLPLDADLRQVVSVMLGANTQHIACCNEQGQVCGDLALEDIAHLLLRAPERAEAAHAAHTMP